MRSSPAKAPARRLRWLALAGLVAAAPKCLLCLAAYLGLGAALGLAGPELCGAPADAATPWTLALVTTGVVAGGAGFFHRLRVRARRRPDVSVN